MMMPPGGYPPFAGKVLAVSAVLGGLLVAALIVAMECGFL